MHNTYIHILLSAVDEDGNNQMGKSKKVELEKMITDVPGIVKIYAKVFSGSKWEEIAFVILVVLSIIMKIYQNLSVNNTKSSQISH